MAFSYPLSLPSVGGIARIRLAPMAKVAVSESPYTFEQQVQAHAGQIWQATVTLMRMQRANAEEWVAFLLKLNGSEGTFLMGDPAGATARGTAGGSPQVNGASQTGNSLITDGWTASATLLAGDYVQLGSGANTRLYKNLIDQTADGGGNMTIDIWPSLRSSPANNDALTVSSATGRWRLASNQMRWDIDDVAVYGIDFGAVEAL